MNLTQPTPLQVATVPVALEGKDVLALAETGSGKTAAYGVPFLATLYDRPQDQGLILVPNREAALKVSKMLSEMSEELKMHGLLLVSDEPFEDQVEEIRKGTDYLIATPDRLAQHLEEKTVFLSYLALLVVDEADVMLEMGQSAALKKILDQLPKNRQTLLFAGSETQALKPILDELLQDPQRISLDFSPSTLFKGGVQFVSVSDRLKVPTLVKELKSKIGKVVVVSQNPKMLDSLKEGLEKEKISVITPEPTAEMKGTTPGNPLHVYLCNWDQVGEQADVDLIVAFDGPDRTYDVFNKLKDLHWSGTEREIWFYQSFSQRSDSRHRHHSGHRDHRDSRGGGHRHHRGGGNRHHRPRDNGMPHHDQQVEPTTLTSHSLSSRGGSDRRPRRGGGHSGGGGGRHRSGGRAGGGSGGPRGRRGPRRDSGNYRRQLGSRVHED